MPEVVDLSKINRKLRRKYGVGTLAFYGAEELAKKVRENWEAGDKDKWVEEYKSGINNPDWETGEKLLKEWYEALEAYSDELSKKVSEVYAKIKAKYLGAKKSILREAKREALGRVAVAIAR